MATRQTPIVRRAVPQRSARPGGGGGSADIRVLCVDDHALLIEGLKAQFALDHGLRCVGHLESADRLVEEVKRLNPDIVLLDIELPGPDVFETADRLHRAAPHQRFVFLSAHIRDGYLAAAYKCGAWGYFAKSDEPADLVTGIKEVVRSAHPTFVMGPKVRQRCRLTPRAPAADAGRPRHDHRGDDRPSTPLQSLTSRELEVLRLIGRGMGRSEVAAQLSRSVKTVDGHQDRLMAKLRLASRAELMRFAIREGLAEA